MSTKYSIFNERMAEEVPMKKIFLLLAFLGTFCAVAFASDAGNAKIGRDYETLYGGPNATVSFTDGLVMAAVAHLKIYDTPERSVVIPKEVKNYKIIRAGKQEAYLIIPHFQKTRMTVRNLTTRKKDGTLHGLLEGKTLVLFCNKDETVLDMLVRNGSGNIQLVSWKAASGPDLADGQPGGVVLEPSQNGLLVDITGTIRHDDGNFINVE
jgi:hypothetical protein